MHSSLSAVVLCIFAQAAGAQCLATPVALEAKTGVVLANSPTMATPKAVVKAPAPHAGGELITTAAAGTRDAPVAVVRGTSVQDSQEHPKRGGTSMLLAALALMSGIALRRFGPPRQ
ncbi:MAG: hypothetical protein H0X13_10360 [Ramlibacter sp.]|nr:hypothetical protein [Ramlibacter sp.]